MQIYNSYSSLEIANIVKGKHVGDNELKINSISYDTRLIFNTVNGLFIALNTKKNNGHSFIDEAYNKGIKCFLVEKLPTKTHNDANYIMVNNSLESLQHWAKIHRQKYDIPIIAITGSYGKTIVKEWIYHLTNSTFNVFRSPKSFNSQLGVALSLLMVAPHHELAIIELGISKGGEMDVLKDIVKPTHTIITNVSDAHIENFKNKSALVQEKEKLLLKENNVYFNKINWPKYQRVLTENGQLITIENKSKQISFEIPHKDEISAINFISCVSMLRLINFDINKIKTLSPTLPRITSRLEKKEGINACTLINDTYSSDSSSIFHALETLKAEAGKAKTTFIYVVSNNDNDIDDERWNNINNWLQQFKISQFIVVGEKSSSIKFNTPALFYKNTSSFEDDFTNLNLYNHHILLKGKNNKLTQLISDKLEAKKHQTKLEIDLNKVEYNFNKYKSHLSKEVKILAMIKAAGYGAGIVEMGKKLQNCQVDFLGVAYVDEGVELRRNGIEVPILVMNVDALSMNNLIEHRLTPAIHDLNQLNQFTSKLIELNIKAFAIHLKINTGMNRLGFDENEIDTLLTFLKSQPEIKVEGIFSHLSASDHIEGERQTKNQIEIFKTLSHKIESHLNIIAIKHILNSAGIERYSNYNFDMVRLGIGLYGISSMIDLKPIATLSSIISKVRTISKGDQIGYGISNKVTKKTKVAIVPIGYADGFSRSLGNGVGKMIVNNKLVPTIGNICMDMTFIDVTDLDVKIGDVVEIFGSNRKIENLAKEANTIPYEILSSISHRVVRVYERDQ
ncbi:MAG: bifunctional UDP-N-acetylmuramoyl-tripeptide:D-alanyl-D-alanine ligase/alanine racemase [Bacteroidota bacterium]|nr:bifunctional UDP-N-acetylmuramoyl-tripeptide:D-alanyl-D-alanine ligase/alanine racemase [Bacteroidota bacterium]